MHRHRPQSPFLFLILGCLVILVTSIILVLPHSTDTKVDTSLTTASFPEFITLQIDESSFSTPSASLWTQASLENFSTQPSSIDKALSLLIPLEKKPKNPFIEDKVKLWVSSLAPTVEKVGKQPSVTVTKNGTSFIIDPGEKGRQLDAEKTVKEIVDLDVFATQSARLATIETGKELTPDAVLESEHFVQKLVGKKIELKTSHFSQKLSLQELAPLLDLPSDFSSGALKELTIQLNEKLSTSPTEPILEMNGKEVLKFVAPKDGRQIDEQALKDALVSHIRTLADAEKVEPINIPFTSQKPAHTLASLNTFGISERIGIGESEYTHSIPNRVSNVALTTSRMHAKIVMPGEEFSFNRYLGEVSAATGFKPAYVIKQGQTVLGDGGGVCQVSSTLFRAILNSGLPITERRGHSYRVGYYEENSKPGFDATVYSPHPDFRFLNDTENAILINAVADSKTLSMYIELWGKADGRKAEIRNYKQWDASPALPTVYQDDPTLPHGKLKQIDFAAPGLKTSFEYVVTYPDGEIKTKTFQTNYTPWAAVYLRGI